MKSIRIPKPVNRAWDAAARNPLLSAALVAAAITAAVGIWWPTTGLILAVAAAPTLIAVARYLAVVPPLREEIRQLRYDLAAKDEELAARTSGNPTAVTLGIIPIREDGSW